MTSDILIYQNPDGNIEIDVRLQEETVWLAQALMGQLFGKDKCTMFKLFCDSCHYVHAERKSNNAININSLNCTPNY